MTCELEVVGGKIAVCWSELPGYAAACVRALSERDHVGLLVVRYAHQGEKPFDEATRRLPVPLHTICAQEAVRRQWEELRALLEQFQPDAAVVSGWAIPAFNRAARWVRRKDGIVLCMSDSQWRFSLRQIVGSVYARLFFRRRYSGMFLPGERARPLALAFGFSGRRLIMGSLSCDWPLFARAHSLRSDAPSAGWPHAFLFVGSLIPRKGIQDLVEAHSGYRRQTSEPWQLHVVGDGPLRHLVDGAEGVRWLGFRQPGGPPPLLATGRPARSGMMESTSYQNAKRDRGRGCGPTSAGC